MSAVTRCWPVLTKAALSLLALLALVGYLWQALVQHAQPFSRIHLIVILVVLLFIRLLYHYEGRIMARSFRELLFHNRALLPIPLLIIAVMVTKSSLLGSRLADHLLLLGALLLLIAGHALRIWAIGHAGRQTRTTAFAAERLATSGPYAHVRNPIYVGNSLIALGLLMVAKVPWLMLLGMGVLCFHYAMVVSAEESSLRTQFGEAYECYYRTVPRFWPRWRPHPSAQGTFDRTIWHSKEYQAWLASACVVVLLVCVQEFLPA